MVVLLTDGDALKLKPHLNVMLNQERKLLFTKKNELCKLVLSFFPDFKKQGGRESSLKALGQDLERIPVAIEAHMLNAARVILSANKKVVEALSEAERSPEQSQLLEKIKRVLELLSPAASASSDGDDVPKVSGEADVLTELMNDILELPEPMDGQVDLFFLLRLILEVHSPALTVASQFPA